MLPVRRLCDLVEFTIPPYIKEGKAYLTIAIGCTGGRHRSVFIAEELAARHICLPVHSDMTDNEVDEVLTAVAAVHDAFTGR